MGNYKKGDVVWTGKGEYAKEVTIARIINNPLLPIRQYTFEPPHDGFACGEQSIRRNEFDEDSKMRDCFIQSKEDEDNDIETFTNTVSAIMRQPMDVDDVDLGIVKSLTSLLFKPDLKFCKWLKNYADGRLIIDVGCGQGHLVRMLKMSGARAMGLEPNFNLTKYKEMSISRGYTPDVNEILPITVEKAKSLINGLGKKALLIFARPCHSDFVEVGIRNMPNEMETLYITLPENIDNKNDLGKYKSNATLIEHEGKSEDNEVVYSIKK